MPNIVFQSPNGVGLGHLSRLTAIALALGEHVPDANIFFAIDGRSHELLEAYGLPFISLPRLKELESPAWGRWPLKSKWRLYRRLSEAVFDSFYPDLVVFDCFASFAFVRIALARRIRFAICVREMKDVEHYYRKSSLVLDSADLIIVPHFDWRHSIPAHLEPKVTCVGQIVRPPPVIEQYRVPSLPRPTVLISGGGGGFPGIIEFYNLALAAFSLCRQELPALSALLVAGPLFHDWAELRLADGVRVSPFEPNMVGLFAAADLVVCQGGYNTVAEVSSVNVPTICIPAPRQSDDQFNRAAVISTSQDNFETCLDISEKELAAKMLYLLNAPSVSRSLPETSMGAVRAAQALASILGSAKE